MIYKALAIELAKNITRKFKLNDNEQRFVITLLEERLMEGFSMSDINLVIKHKCLTSTGKKDVLNIKAALSSKLFGMLLDESYIHEQEMHRPKQLVPVEFSGTYEQYIESLNN